MNFRHLFIAWDVVDDYHPWSDPVLNQKIYSFEMTEFFLMPLRLGDLLLAYVTA